MEPSESFRISAVCSVTRCSSCLWWALHRGLGFHLGQRPLDAGHDVIQLERLADVVLGSVLHASNDGVAVRHRSRHNNCRVGIQPSDVWQQLVSGPARHRDVENDEVHGSVPQLFECFFGVLRLLTTVALAQQLLPEAPPHHLFVVDDEHLAVLGGYCHVLGHPRCHRFMYYRAQLTGRERLWQETGLDFVEEGPNLVT